MFSLPIITPIYEIIKGINIMTTDYYIILRAAGKFKVGGASGLKTADLEAAGKKAFVKIVKLYAKFR